MQHIVTPENITVVLTSGLKTIPTDHPNFEDIKASILADDEETVERLADIPRAIETWSEGRITVVGDQVMHDGVNLPDNVLARYIMQMMSEGWPIDPICKFAERMMSNPNYQLVRGQISTFVLANKYPISDDGRLLVPKGVNPDFTSVHDRKTDNSVGNIVEMARNMVDDDPERTCSAGLHVGNWDYVGGWGMVKVLVAVDPADIVSVPYEYGATKMRVCKYEVLRVLEDYSNDIEHLQDTVVIDTGFANEGTWTFTLRGMDEDGNILDYVTTETGDDRDEAEEMAIDAFAQDYGELDTDTVKVRKVVPVVKPSSTTFDVMDTSDGEQVKITIYGDLSVDDAVACLEQHPDWLRLVTPQIL